ncbi:hypothetical protein LTR78_002670 [Recurvomyces mirabilis]|uniref:Ketoreductase domain-containing protein n=1 Tax=Recurvomyces mirabilis TaxID=574656 RepID=A0AAE1C4F4_9PEZI|nr:hypothetical protein LTR78_002670 [Recurvomyces mirabilis]KAK5157599.1 hypothetical protein LTS14_004364 [Recurvomyces mirabilis]
MPYDFSGKVCLITGAASGIGRATAQKMADSGCDLSLCDINLMGLQETMRQCGRKCGLMVVDVGNSVHCNDVVQDSIDRFGRLNFVFNCAGVNPTAYPLTDTTDEYYDKLMNTNVRGTYNVTRAAVPHLQAGAAIVNTSSIMGVTASANYAIYCATKWAIVGFTKPGYINTPTNAGVLAGPQAIAEAEKMIAFGRMGTAEEVADVVAFLFR